LIDPYSPAVLLRVSTGLSVSTVLITALCLWGLERDTQAPATEARLKRLGDFKAAFKSTWAEPLARRFTVFVFLSMLAYSAQDLILEPFAGAVHGRSPGKTTQLSGWHHGGVLIGMLLVAAAGSRRAGGRLGSIQSWMIGGCLLSALATVGLALSSWTAASGPWPLHANVVFLGTANGAFSIAAIATMMRLAGGEGSGKEGTRMGLWGAAQAIAFGLGGLVGTGASDLAHAWMGESSAAYAAVFAFQAMLFMASATVALRLGQHASAPAPTGVTPMNLQGDPQT
jgi:BCD family chlorophyll transporter-like MFS transporter